MTDQNSEIGDRFVIDDPLFGGAGDGGENFKQLRKHSLVYVASPYTLYPHGLDRAYTDVCEVCWWLTSAGVNHYSPIIYVHPMAAIWDVDRTNGTFWINFLKPMMAACDALVVVEMDGWADSAGVAIEEAIFESNGKPVYHLNPETMELTLESSADRETGR